MKPVTEQNPRTAEEHYQRGVAMMNVGRWDDARESLDKARKAAPKADYIHYALAALDCLTGEADSALKNLKVAIELRPEIAITRAMTRTSHFFKKTRVYRAALSRKRRDGRLIRISANSRHMGLSVAARCSLCFEFLF